MNTYMTFIPWMLLNIIADFVECQPRIIGGEKGDLSTIPFAVYIMAEAKDAKGRTGYIRCTGSLISLEWVLSAAHCFKVTKHTEHYEVSNYIFMYFQ